MKAMRVNNAQQSPLLVAASLNQPEPGDGELLIRVRATGVTPTELLWYPTTHTKAGGARTDAVPGHEFSGVIAALGKGANNFNVGDEIYGMNDWFAEGATAEFCLTQPQNIALKPKSLTHELAATVPIGALTAWQGLLDHARNAGWGRRANSRCRRRSGAIRGSIGASARRLRDCDIVRSQIGICETAWSR